MSQFSGSILADEDRFFDAIIGGVFYCSDPPDCIEKDEDKNKYKIVFVCCANAFIPIYPIWLLFTPSNTHIQ